MTFSICHATARPHSWLQSHDAWMGAARGSLQNIEYVVCLDRRWGFFNEHAEFARIRGARVVWNCGRRCAVDAYSYAAAASRGNILILSSDDMRPCVGWDEELAELTLGRVVHGEEFVVHASSGTPVDDRGLMVLPILSRARYDRLGYALYPEYDGVCSDDDLSEHARLDGCVVDARHLVFPHLHPAVGKAEEDDVYRWQNRAEAYAVGQEILGRRRAAKFDDLRGG